ncbi:MAG: hypothetical protein HY819_16580 [Acidobacteria bacterium]|nr:hypothetical protein [Acidobacteriota bacterium]
MKYLATFLFLVLTLTLTACPFKKKKETPPWTIYQKNTETVLDSLSTLRSLEIEEIDIKIYKENLKNTEAIVNEFLNSNQTTPLRPSYLEIQQTIEDFRLASELLEKKRARVGDNFFANKLFATNDRELFSKVKERYKLGPELQIASHSYYYIDPILHEALRSANNHIERARKKVKDEVILEARAARAAKNGTKPDSDPQLDNSTPEPTPSPSSTPNQTKPKNPLEKKPNQTSSTP